MTRRRYPMSRVTPLHAMARTCCPSNTGQGGGRHHFWFIPTTVHAKRSIVSRAADPCIPRTASRLRYINPIDGGYVYPTIAVFIQWLPKGFSGQTYRSTDGAVFNVVEGSGRVHVGDADFVFEPNDVFVVPPWTPYHLKIDNECVLFSYSDRAAQEALGFWREKDPSNSAARQ
jgi:gentisate 1,2-dioxygenase